MDGFTFKEIILNGSERHAITGKAGSELLKALVSAGTLQKTLVLYTDF